MVGPKKDSDPSGFRDWTIGRCREFMDRWDDNEEVMPEMAALAMTCEEFDVDFDDAEWVEIVASLEGEK